MDPVEINAGAWYLRALRDDDRISDVQVLASVDPSPAARIRDADRGWADESSFTWAVCEPTTGLMVALVCAYRTREAHDTGEGSESGGPIVRLEATSVPGTDPAAREQGLRVATRFVADGLGLSVRA